MSNEIDIVIETKIKEAIQGLADAKIARIVNAKPKNERIAFTRKLKKIQELVESLEPIEAKILDIVLNEKYPIMDQIQELRTTMIKECVHPKDQLVYHNNGEEEYVECKFCNAKLMVK